MPLPPKYSAFEIERRWLVQRDVAEELPFDRLRNIDDHYIDGTELRLRIVREATHEPVYKLGKKYVPLSGWQPVVSIYLSAREASVLEQLPSRVSRKERRSVAGGVVDIYRYPEQAWAIFEVEFTSAQEAAAFVPPPYVDREVTGLAAWTGYMLANSAD